MRSCPWKWRIWSQLPTRSPAAQLNTPATGLNQLLTAVSHLYCLCKVWSSSEDAYRIRPCRWWDKECPVPGSYQDLQVRVWLCVYVETAVRDGTSHSRLTDSETSGFGETVVPKSRTWAKKPIEAVKVMNHTASSHFTHLESFSSFALHHLKLHVKFVVPWNTSTASETRLSKRQSPDLCRCSAFTVVRFFFVRHSATLKYIP